MENFPIPNSTVTGLIIATVIGIFSKWVEKMMHRSTEHFSEATQLRKELREEINNLVSQLNTEKQDNKALREELDEWKTKYYEKIEETRHQK